MTPLDRRFPRLARVVRDTPSLATGGALVIAAAVVALCGAAVHELAEWVLHDGTGQSVDEWIVEQIAARRTSTRTDLFELITNLADPWFVVLVVVVTAALLWRRGHRGLALVVAATSAGTAAVTTTLKLVIGRARPFEDQRLVETAGHAFPSGHAAQSVALYGALAMVTAMIVSGRALRLLVALAAAGIALAVGVSRVYLGVHWPSDVVSGWLIGVAWLVAVTASAWTLRRLDRPQRWWPEPRTTRRAAGTPRRA